MPLTPANLRANDLPAPVGTPARPYLGWHFAPAAPNQRQMAYQILVSAAPAPLTAGRGEVWDSGPVPSGRQNHIVYAGPPLGANTSYYWTVRVWDEHGDPGPYAEPAAFVTGLLTNADWAGAQWIWRETDDADDYTCYRHAFTLPAGAIARAAVFVTAVHKYTLYLNGHRIGAGPAYHYPQYQYYNAYDLTPHLRPGGRNVFAVLTHWFGGGQGRPASARGLLLLAAIDYADGRRVRVGTDASWRQRRAGGWVLGQPSRNDEGVGYVEVIDAAQLTPAWRLPDHDDTDWAPAAVLGPHPTPPWTGTLQPDLSRIVEHEVAPAAITAVGGGTYVADLGRVRAGRPRLLVSGAAAGTRLTVRGGYTLTSAGTIDPRTWQNTDMGYAAVASGRDFVFEPLEYLGMRYVQVEGAPRPVTPENFSFIERHAVLDETRAAFESSDATLNQVWDFMRASLYLGAQEQFLDTPTREKGGFLVDSANESLAAMAAFGERVLTRRVLSEFVQSMDHHWPGAADRGRMNAVYPNGDGARDIPDFTQAFLPWAWDYYWQTGDEHWLSEHYPRLKDTAAYVRRHVDPGTGLVHTLTGGGGPYLHGIVDWPPAMRYGYDMAASARTVINALAYADFRVMARMATVLGLTADADQYAAWAEALELAMNARLLNAAGVYVDGLHADGTPSAHASQHANALPLALGLVPAERRATVSAHVKRLKMSMGMVTVGWLIRALGEAGEGEHLLALYTNPAWDGWAKCLAQGATCTWESWDAHLGGDLSQSHPWGAVGLCGLQQYVLGVQALAPQCEHVRLRPLAFGGALTWAGGRVPTDRGDLWVRWEAGAGRFELRVTLPANMRATVCLPGGAAGQTVRVDGQPVAGSVEEGYTVVEGLGSGAHTLERGA